MRRVTDTVQVGASRAVRLRQAREAYELVGEVRGDGHYLVVDDVCTTGASVEAVCSALRRGGAGYVAVVVIARAE